MVTETSSVDELLTVGMTVLNFVADHPGMFGRLRSARIITGGATEEDIDRGLTFDPASILDLHPGTVVIIIDSMIESGRIVKTYGDRPRLALTREGFGLLAAIGTVERSPHCDEAAKANKRREESTQRERLHAERPDAGYLEAYLD